MIVFATRRGALSAQALDHLPGSFWKHHLVWQEPLRSEDKKLLRLIQYINSTTNYRLAATVADQPEDLELHLYVDADFAGEKQDAKSTSGGFLALVGSKAWKPNSVWARDSVQRYRWTVRALLRALRNPSALWQELLPSV